jgi:hypothetical protein
MRLACSLAILVRVSDKTDDDDDYDNNDAADDDSTKMISKRTKRLS